MKSSILVTVPAKVTATIEDCNDNDGGSDGDGGSNGDDDGDDDGNGSQ